MFYLLCFICYALSAMLYLICFICHALSAILHLLCFICYALSSMLYLYGDALNPWGDIMAVAEAWCVCSKYAVIAMGVPTMVSKGLDINVFNQHKVYGPVLYPFLMTNWEFVWPTLGKPIIPLRRFFIVYFSDEDRITPDSVTKEEGEWKHQPFFVFKKNNGEFFG